MKIRYLFLLLTTWAMGGCYKTYTIDLEEDHVKPVLNSLLMRDSVVIARVSQSSLKDVRNIRYRPDAEVKLYVDGVFRENLRLRQEGNLTYFESSAPVDPARQYRITAAIPGFPEVMGEDVIPPPVPQVDAGIKIVEPAPDMATDHLKIRIHDKAGEQNYYRIRLYRVFKDYQGNTRRSGPVLIAKDGTQDWELFGDDWMTEILLDDALFDGRSPQFRFKAYKSGYDEPFALEITQLTKTSFLYFRSAMLQRERQGNDVAEKVSVYGNIRNGLGIVGGMSVHYLTIIPER